MAAADASEQSAALPGRWIIVASWLSVVALAVVGVPDALGVSALDGVTAWLSLVLFLVSLPVWMYAFGLAVVRSARGDDIAVASLFFLQGSAPKRVRWHLMSATAASIVVAALTAAASPAVVLVPMLPLGLAGLWGARYGTYPARPARPTAQGGRR